jgi:hypothetical protein
MSARIGGFAALVGILPLVGCGGDAKEGAGGAISASHPESGAGTGSDSGPASGIAGDGAPGGSIVHGPPGCGFESAAFCDTFDAPSKTTGRAGELDPAVWSGSRIQPQLPTYSTNAFAIGLATLPPCRDGLPAKVAPDQDTLICDPIDTIASNHLLVAAAAQNYGMNSYRVRQPFDFAGRTGKIVFDAEGVPPQLLGWVSLEVTEDPIGAPSYDFLLNDEGGMVPKNGFELEFSYSCNTSPPTQFSLSSLHVFENYADTVTWADWQSPTPAPCVAVAPGKLNHFEVAVSQESIEVLVSAASDDGVTFAPPVRMLKQAVQLPFSRGYVHVSVHNHATLKYSGKGSCSSDADCQTFGANYTCSHDQTCVVDAWVVRFDSVGFDGPIVDGIQEYEAADSLVPSGTAPGLTNIGYQVGDAADGARDELRFKGVTLQGATAARMAISTWYPDTTTQQSMLRFRLNGKTWHDRPLTPDEWTAWSAPIIVGRDAGGCQGAIDQTIDVPLEDLVPGDNTVEFVTVNVPGGYRAAIANVDLIVESR